VLSCTVLNQPVVYHALLPIRPEINNKNLQLYSKPGP
jgi:hypothetical protein